MKTKFVVFSDLDGSLLNHHDYSFDAALPMLEFLKNSAIDLIFTTSKTKKECEILQDKMGLKSPFIVENGACIYYPNGKIEQLGCTHQEIKEFIDTYKEQFGVLSFSDMSVEKVMQYTSFDKSQAALAKQRDFSEPFLLEDETKLEALKEIASVHGMKILKGGRFYHCVGKGQDKGMAINRVKKHYAGYQSVGLGDNYNDIAMLESVDIPILIPYHENSYIPFKLPNLIKSPHVGSLGWNESLKKVLIDES